MPGPKGVAEYVQFDNAAMVGMAISLFLAFRKHLRPRNQELLSLRTCQCNANHPPSILEYQFPIPFSLCQADLQNCTLRCNARLVNGDRDNCSETCRESFQCGSAEAPTSVYDLRPATSVLTVNPTAASRTLATSISKETTGTSSGSRATTSEECGKNMVGVVVVVMAWSILVWTNM